MGRAVPRADHQKRTRKSQRRTTTLPKIIPTDKMLSYSGSYGHSSKGICDPKREGPFSYYIQRVKDNCHGWHSGTISFTKPQLIGKVFRLGKYDYRIKSKINSPKNNYRW